MLFCIIASIRADQRKPPEAAFENRHAITAVANCPHFKNKKKNPSYFLF